MPGGYVNCIVVAQRHLWGMTQATQDVIGYPQSYRVVVKARPPRLGSKSFCWEILHEDGTKAPIEKSTKPYRSMEAAYSDGAIAIRRFR